MRLVLSLIAAGLFASLLAAASVTIDTDTVGPTVRVEDEGKVVFVHRFDRPQNLHETALSPSGHYVLIWHDERPPRRLKVFRVDDGKLLADFVPGFGGQMRWTLGDKILHSWGCGTNCQNIRVYDIAGGTLHEENVSGHKLTAWGYYITYPTVRAAADRSVSKYDVNTGQTIQLHDNLPATPIDVAWDGRTVVFSFANHQDVRIDTDPRPAQQ